jgi:mercuric ion binding protein
MKTPILIFFFALLLCGSAYSQKAAKTADVCILTSSKCDDCKMRIETALKSVKGVKKANLDIPTHKACVTYKPKKTDVGQLRKAIALAGYDADEVKADQEAYDNLPQCCRKGGHE